MSLSERELTNSAMETALGGVSVSAVAISVLRPHDSLRSGSERGGRSGKDRGNRNEIRGLPRQHALNYCALTHNDRVGERIE